ncbi:MAG: hypothetical protein C5B50_13710 [Verrucomicrobia bacterium]|nr:MAG: hypothetical protein C5B50_13710 [Verrucomicrobiota bacterium]
MKLKFFTMDFLGRSLQRGRSQVAGNRGADHNGSLARIHNVESVPGVCPQNQLLPVTITSPRRLASVSLPFKPGLSHEPPTISKPLTMVAIGGSATIGQ